MAHGVAAAADCCVMWTCLSWLLQVDAIRRAIAVQVAQVKRCVKGKGVDRHLMGLQWAAQDKGLPQLEFFNHAVHRHSCCCVALTDCCLWSVVELFCCVLVV